MLKGDDYLTFLFSLLQIIIPLFIVSFKKQRKKVEKRVEKG